MNSERKKILFLPSWYPNRTAPALGNFIQRHAAAVSEFHDVAVLYAVADPALSEGFEVEISDHNGVTEVIVYYKKVSSNFPLVSSFIKFRRFFKAYSKGYSQLSGLFGKPDLLHLHVIWRAAVFARSLHERLRVPLVISEHWSGYMPEDGSYRSGAMKAYTQGIVRNASAVIAVSERMKEAMLSHGLKNDYRVIPNVVDTELFRPAQSPPEGKIRMVHVSTVNEREKNISGILRVIKKLSEERDDFILEIIGDSPERAGFEEMGRQMGVLGKHVIFQGYKSIDEVAERMRSSHFFVMFSNYEGLPCVILEAMASGLPVVATRTGGIPSVVNDEQGILVDVKDEAGLKLALQAMMASWNAYDRARLRKYAEDNFSFHNVGRQIAEVYNELLK
jgi:glycosyltransferase involved in cell wall biosynthesis